MGWLSSLLVRHAALVFALKTFAAAMLAYSIALWLDMPRPYWAMASVYITSNPLAGATSSKAVYRILGTLIGAAGTLALIPNLVDAPELLSLAVALWVGTFLYLALIDGTPRSYVFLLAGYTVALLGFPIISVPELTFDILVSRVQEITLGIICASVVSMIVLPRSVASTITAQADAWLADARRLGGDVLTCRGGEQERDGERMRLAAAAAQIDELRSHLGYETATSANTVRGLERLRRHMLALLPLLASIEDHIRALDSHGGASAGIAEISTRVARWLGEGGQDRQEADSLRAALNGVQPALDTDAGTSEIMLAGLVTELRDLVQIMQDCRLLREAIADGRDPDSLPLVVAAEILQAAVLHRDHGLALWSAAAIALSVLAGCAFWIATSWPDGASAPLFGAVVGSFFANVDDQLPAYRNVFKVVLIAVAINAVYLFAVLPRITTLEALIAALMPVYVLLSWMTARPATARVGYLLSILVPVQLALDSSYSADFASFANSSIALMFGVVITGAVAAIVRFAGAGWIAKRLLRSNWRTLAAVAEGTSRQDRAAVASLMQHRMALLAARIAVVPAAARSDAANLRQLRTTLSLIDLRRAGSGLSRRARADIDALLAGLASAFRTHAIGPLPGEPVAGLDSAIAITLQEQAGEARNAALVGLAGIRSELFPAASAYAPHAPEHMRRAA
jgi:uncharacterized membrane protein YccC